MHVPLNNQLASITDPAEAIAFWPQYLKAWTTWNHLLVCNTFCESPKELQIEHAVETYKLIPNAELAVIPDASHFVLFSEQERVIAAVKHFLEKPEKRIPLVIGGTGYHPGETR